MPLADTIYAASLDWALTHNEKFGDTDLFPVPFEYRAIRHCWRSVKDALLATDLGDYRVRPLRRFLIPKPGVGFRVGVQLDPLDWMMYTAVVYEAAELVEARRIPVDRHVACSYRVQLDPAGSFFGKDNGWREYHERSAELAGGGEYAYVLTADIADFYNQASHHRIENALADAEVPPTRAGHIEDLLMKFTAKQSRGLPVGPFASIVLAEANLNDVDRWLLNRGITFTRYVDDYRMFCKSRRGVIQALHDLTDYLYTAHRLTLQLSKTKIFKVEDFVARELHDPSEEEERGKTDKLAKLIWSAFYDTGITDAEQLDKEAVGRAIRENIGELFTGCVARRPLNLGLARYLLRRAARIKSGVLITPVFEHLRELLPVLRDVALYLRSVRRALGPEPHGKALTEFLTTSDYVGLPFVQLWGVEILTDNCRLSSVSDVRRVAESAQRLVGVRAMAKWARRFRQLDWVRATKETWANHAPWDRRAVVWTGAVLPEDERNKWLSLVRDESTDLLDRVVAEAGLANADPLAEGGY